MRYRGGMDSDLHDMPFTRHVFSARPSLLIKWEASRKAAGLAIDIETCEIRSWSACNFDPYDLEEASRRPGRHGIGG